MIGFISKLFGGNKSEKDIKIIQPRVERNQPVCGSLPIPFQRRIESKNGRIQTKNKRSSQEIDTEIADLKKAEELPFSDITGKDTLYIEMDATEERP